ncbi:UNVERIFIED_CONTAM: Toxoplasma gondii family B protein [Hammondia hammondi]|eukprot:XP_008887272.1 Toxoplasma gondii family B protein [Hammondia hammondi]
MHVNSALLRIVSWHSLINMKVTPPSAAALAFFVLFLCDMNNCCVKTRAMAAAGVASDTVSATDGIHTASAVRSSGVPVEVKQQETHAALLMTSRSIPATKKAAAIRRRKITTAVSAGAVLTAVLGLLVAVAKLQECRQKLVTDTNGTTEGHTRRRLAEGGDDEDDCVSMSSASLGRQWSACHFQPDRVSTSPALCSSTTTCRHFLPSSYFPVQLHDCAPWFSESTSSPLRQKFSGQCDSELLLTQCGVPWTAFPPPTLHLHSSQ